MVIIAGLGNPGDEYENTRHNVGYHFVIELCKKLHIDFLADASAYRANHFLKTKIADQEVVFCLPKGYMNNSGEAIHQILNFYGDNDAKDLWVVHDDIEVPFGQVRIKLGGTSAGHNGIKSVDDAIGTHYWRIRIGVGRPAEPQQDLAHYVLSRFTEAEKAALDPIIDQTATYLLKSLEEGKLTSAKLTTKNA